MAKLSRQTRETIKTIAVLLIIALLIAFYVVYPLNRTKAIMGRLDLDNYNPDSTLANDATLWTDDSIMVDTFRVESDGLTSLACLYAPLDTAIYDSAKGTVLLLHGYHQNRDSLIGVARMLVDSGYTVAAVDQRAAGRSTGKYIGEGQYEGDDVAAIISYLDLRGEIAHPFVILGFDRGADGALLDARSEQRVDAVVAVTPYLSTTRMLDRLHELYHTYWFPFYRSMMWWWYNIRSSYAATYRETDDVRAVTCRTLLFVAPGRMNDREVDLLRERSDSAKLEIRPLPADRTQLWEDFFKFLATVH